MKTETIYEVNEYDAISQETLKDNRSVYDQVPFHLTQAGVERNRAMIALWKLAQQVVAGIVLRWQDRLNERKAVKELGSLGSELLKDLGLTKGDLDRLRAGALTTLQLETERRISADSRKSINRPARLLRLPGKRPAIEAPDRTRLLKKCG